MIQIGYTNDIQLYIKYNFFLFSLYKRKCELATVRVQIDTNYKINIINGAKPTLDRVKVSLRSIYEKTSQLCYNSVNLQFTRLSSPSRYKQHSTLHPPSIYIEAILQTAYLRWRYQSNWLAPTENKTGN